MNVVVTGASKGIGKAIATRLAKENYNLAICSRNKEDLNKVVERLKSLNPSIQVYAQLCDVSKKAQVQNFAFFVKEKFSQVDVLVNNAGAFLAGNIIDEADGQLENLINTNLYSAYHLSRALAPQMIEKKSGHIINMCSISSLHAYPYGSSYAISKHALLGLSRGLREELKEHNVRVTSILPGAVLTEAWAGANITEEKFIKPEDIAAIVCNSIQLSDAANMEEIVIRPTLGDI